MHQKKECLTLFVKIKQKFRASMGFNTLGSILTVKLANPNATKFKPDKALLKSAKSATWEYNKRHSSSTSSTSSSTKNST